MEGFLILMLAMSLYLHNVDGGYIPRYGLNFTVSYNESRPGSPSLSRRFPDIEHIIEDNYEYFLSGLNFEAVTDRILCGAADKLYLLDSDLQQVESFTWLADPSQLMPTSPSSCASQNSATKEFTCRNHIRVYEKIPTVTDSTELLVCGSRATHDPQCRVLQANPDSLQDNSPVVVASPGIVSYYPGFSQFGQFRNDVEGDRTYFTAGFFEGVNGLGRHFSLSYQDITTTPTPGGDTTYSLDTRARFGTIDDNNWLRFPVTFVDFLRLDYEPLEDIGNDYDYQFYFGFLRENLFTTGNGNDDDVIQSRVVRICRNDPGFTNVSVGESAHFTTYMKARIYCERQLATGDQFQGAINYLYNELTSMTFTNAGRHFREGTYGKKLYGAFSGPHTGPHGSAVCVYSAENTGRSESGTGRSQSMFDVFREDLIVPGTDTHVEHSFVECDPAGRDPVEAQKILIHQNVAQLGSDPLLVMEGVIVTQMAVDEQCILTGLESGHSCVNQDILFLGTDEGKIMKVTFANNGTRMTSVFPVVAEEISLDDGNSIEKMTLHRVEGEDYLFVNTHSKLYRFPLERCSRHQTCIECVGSRDPYCVWDTVEDECIRTPFSVAGDDEMEVDPRYRQNIITGRDADTPGCAAEVDCKLHTSAFNYSSLQVDITCTNAVTTWVTVGVEGAGSLTVSKPVVNLVDGSGSTTVSGTIGLHTYLITVEANDDTSPDGVTSFTSLLTTPPGVPFITPEDVIIDSITNTSVRITLNVGTLTDYFHEYGFQIHINDIDIPYQSFSTSTSIDITDLSPATDYQFSVNLTNSAGSSTLENVGFRTLDGLPEEIDSLNFLSSFTSVYLTWTPPTTTNGPIVGYVVRVRDESSVGGEREVVKGCAGESGAPVTDYSVTGLSPFTQYTFTVAACTSAGEGRETSVTTTTLCSAPSPVSNLQLSPDPTSVSSLSYSWTQPSSLNGDPTTLRYRVETSCNGDQNTEEVGPSVLQGTIENLSVLTFCCITVTPTNNCPGQSLVVGLPREECARSSDIVPGPVRSLQMQQLNQRGLLILWDPPENYARAGLEYRVAIFNSNGIPVTSVSVFNEAYLSADQLEPSTLYNVTVSARSSQGLGQSQEAMGYTLPLPPSPPTDLQLTVVAADSLSVNFSLSWSHFDADTHQITGYEAVMRCNEEQFEPVTTTSQLVNFIFSNPASNFAWCTAQVLAINNAGKGNYSSLASIAIPTTSPSTPRCFLVNNHQVNNQDLYISISFDVTHPFSLDSLRIEYILNRFGTSDGVHESQPFNSSNVLNLKVARSTKYDFQLRLCNVHGCGGYCQQLRDFTTDLVPPKAPNVVVSDVSYNSATVSWETSPLENTDHIIYILQISSSRGSRTISLPGTITSQLLEQLEPDSLYSAALQVNDTLNNIAGIFGAVETFRTENGTPSEPRFLQVYLPNTTSLTMVWATPETPNGTLQFYEVGYSDFVETGCEKIAENGMVVQVDADQFKFETREDKDFEFKGFLLVCVRAYTDQPGPWVFDTLTEVTTGANTGRLGSGDECNSVLAVAIVAGLAVISCIVALVVLACICRSTQVMDKSTKVSPQRTNPMDYAAKGSSTPPSDTLDSPDVDASGPGNMYTDPHFHSAQSLDTGYEESGGLPPHASLNSQMSVRSTAPLHPNGSRR